MEIIKRSNGNDIKIYATTLENYAVEQIKELGDFEPYKNSKIRIMPDCHIGSGCTVGTTLEIKDKLTPNLVGVDIGCGMLTVKLKETDIDLPKLDAIINEFVPHGFKTHNKPTVNFDFSQLRAEKLNIKRAKVSIGSLGGGNHFIEVGKNSKGELFLVVHSGSRNIGAQVAEFYQKIAIRNLVSKTKESELLIESLKEDGRENEVAKELDELKKLGCNKKLAYLTGDDYDNYLHDMKVIQQYAILNRRTIANIILEKTELTQIEDFETIHNYIDFDRMILRKGAVSAEEGEQLLIPINMRDGSIIAKGKGNADWNYSAPHGAGRLLGRKQAHKNLNIEEYKEQMKDVYSTSVVSKTLDEAPNAYRSMNEIVDAIADTVDIVDIIKPIYNFKSH